MSNFEILEGSVVDLLPMLPDNHFQTCVTSPPYWCLRDYGVTAQLGLEKTFDEYLENQVAVFRELRRTLRTDGTLWLNMGDSYCQKSIPSGDRGKGLQQTHTASWFKSPRNTPDGMKPKDLIGQPWTLAFALRADGWYLRADIIWAKPNPMPESVTDRPTKAHEYLFLLSKSDRYYYNANAIKEPVSQVTIDWLSQPNFENQHGGPKDPVNGGEGSPNRSARRTIENLKKRMPAGWATGLDHSAVGHNVEKNRKALSESGLRIGKFRDSQRKQDMVVHPRRHSKNNNGFQERWDDSLKKGSAILTRNKRSVWTIPTQPFLEAHFATFPEDLVKPCVLAGTRPGDLVLDPYSGSGTTGKVACGLGRRYVGIELNPEYAQMSRRRVMGPLFAEAV